MFEKIEKFNLPNIEEKVLEFWKTNNVFEKVKNERKGSKKFVFYEGPPTANGKPGIHHVLARAFKDAIPRYKTMQGFDVPRKAGWDTHGLPVELEVEKKLGFNSKEDIEDYGIGKFNQKCKESVWKYKDEWENLTERIGFWLDMDKPYITYENSYMETLWWIVKRAADKGNLFKGHKIVPWCPRCGTGLSSHELAQGYKDVTEDSVFMKFKLSEGQKINDFKIDKKTYILSWTTTPWTLPGNVALAVGDEIDYVILGVGDEKWILAETRLEILDEEYEVLEKVKGSNLLNLDYVPLFDVENLKKNDKVYKIYSADFVTTEDGTGVVHTAVMYGEDDYIFGKEVGLPEYHTVDEQGRFKKSVVGFDGMKVKDEETNKKIFDELSKKGFLLKKQEYTHEYPHCWRCDTPVLYYGRESWFFNMSSLRKELVKENNNINWVPSHIKEGRFGEWIKGAKDWAISRERYWGTPLPIWECNSCDNREILGSMSEIDEKLGSSTNDYILMRHGEGEHNVGRFLDGNPEELEKISLTDEGKKEVLEKIKKLKSKKVDLIICSDFKRTKQTAEIISKELDIEVLTDERIREFNSGDLNGKPDKELGNIYGKPSDKFIKKPEGGESLRDVSKRVSEFLLDVDKKYKDKKILIISHAWPLWMMESVMKGWSEENSVWQRQDLLKSGKNGFFETSEIHNVKLLNLPRNIYGFADLHRPYVDDVRFKCNKCGKEMKRVPEVMDVWFDSGSMPFAQAHFPFEQQSGLFKKVPNPNKKIDYPAGYICEAMDQTRGWFYTLLSTAALLGYEKPYKNVISLGLILDENGQKMSKSKGNVVNPWDAIDDYGADVIRWYFYIVNKPGEPKRFDGDEVKKTLRSFIFTIYNSFSFLNLYIENKIDYKEKIKTENVLDKWIFSRLNDTILSSEKLLEEYNIGGACRKIELFVEDLSKWYIRRSRRRFQKSENKEDLNNVVFVLGYALLQLSKITAPFIPFFAEGLYQSLKKKFKNYNFKLSVHLEGWPKVDKSLIDNKLEEKMELVRIIASEVLSVREKERIKVRQPLQDLSISNKELEGEEELLNILKEEINVKEVIINKDLKGIKLNTEITHELKEEGLLRDLVRKIQKGRQDAGLDPKDEIRLGITGDENIKKLVDKNSEKLQKEIKAIDISSKLLDKYDLKFETKISNHHLEITIYKV